MSQTNEITEIEFDMQEIHELSVGLLQELEDQNVNVGTGAVTFALSLGRLLSPKRLEMEEELAFVQSVMEFGATYFAGGSTN